LLERRVLLESVSAVELVKPDEASIHQVQGEGGEHMKITVSEQVMPSSELSKSV
jgi:hypothetical protein